MSALKGARCVGKHDLFDSIHIDDHRAAIAICFECPALTACQQRYEKAATDTDVRPPYGPRGTWAGKLRGVNEPTNSRKQLDWQEEMFTLDEARKARNAYSGGDRSDWAVIGKRVYFRLLKREQESRKRAS
jgi:hypothetical protein